MRERQLVESQHSWKRLMCSRVCASGLRMSRSCHFRGSPRPRLLSPSPTGMCDRSVLCDRCSSPSLSDQQFRPAHSAYHATHRRIGPCQLLFLLIRQFDILWRCSNQVTRILRCLPEPFSTLLFYDMCLHHFRLITFILRIFINEVEYHHRRTTTATTTPQDETGHVNYFFVNFDKSCQINSRY